MPRNAQPDVEERIIDASLQIILRVGISGLRVRDVATASGTTVAMVYRRFIDRDGLLDASVTHFYERRIRSIVSQVRDIAFHRPDITIEDVLDALPFPDYPNSEALRSVIARVPALAHENSVFRRKIEAIVEEQYPLLEEGVIAIVDRLPPPERFDYRIITTLVLHQNWTLNDLRGPYRVTNAEYRDFMRRLLISSTPI